MKPSPRFLIPILFVSAVIALGLAPSAKADSFSISLISSGSGLYDYGFTVPGLSSVAFNQNETITFTGLSGVTGASVLFLDFTVQSFSSSSVTFVAGASSTFTNGLNVPFTFGDFIIDSTAPSGTVDWSGTARGQLNTGTVSGPVSSGVPEPSSLLLLAGGLTSLLGLRRKRTL